MYMLMSASIETISLCTANMMDAKTSRHLGITLSMGSERETSQLTLNLKEKSQGFTSLKSCMYPEQTEKF